MHSSSHSPTMLTYPSGSRARIDLRGGHNRFQDIIMEHPLLSQDIIIIIATRANAHYQWTPPLITTDY